jgi:hypothetical protein
MRRNSRTRIPGTRGFVLVAILVVLALAMALFGLWAQSAVREQRWLDGEALRLEALRLAEAGVARGIARRAIDPDYANETWRIPAADVGGRHAAEVRIRVTPEGAALRIAATADFPAGAVRRARVTKQIEISNPAPGDES